MLTRLSPRLSQEESSNLQLHLLDSVDQALVAVTPQGKIVFWNRSATDLFGWMSGEAEGLDLGDLLGSPSMTQSIREHPAALSLDHGWAGDFAVLRRDGTTFMSRLRFSLIFHGPQMLIGVVFLLEDGSNRLLLKEANRLLAEAAALLSDNLDYREPLRTLARLAVPSVADWCAVHLWSEAGVIERVTGAARSEITESQSIDRWLEHSLLNDEHDGLRAVLKSGRPILVTEVLPNTAASRAAVQSYMIIPLKAQPRTIGTITFVTSESGRHLDQVTLSVAENLASHVAIYMDKALLVRKSQALNVELGLRVDERSAKLRSALARVKQSETTVRSLFRISNHLNSTLDIKSILEQLAQEAIRIVGGENGFAGLSTAMGMTTQTYFRKGTPEPFNHLWPIGEGIPGRVLQTKKTYMTNDPRSDSHVDRELSNCLGARSMICTPIVNSVGVVLGYFAVINKKRSKGFTQDDEKKLLSLVPVASIAIQNALAFQQRLADLIELGEASQQLRALAANLESAREQERIRIARDLHDELGQALTAMKFDLALLTSRLVERDPALASQVTQVSKQMDLMIKTVRRICTELRPGMLEDLGLPASLDWVARDFQKTTGIGCTVVGADCVLNVESLSAPSALAVYRIFQEALTNVARHSGARNVKVDITTTSQELIVQIQDDGRGISSLEVNGRKTLGLLGMRERAQRLGGSVSFFGSPSGTLVSVMFPMEKNNVENSARR